MRMMTTVTVSAALAVAAIPSLAAAANADLPKRKPGHWQLTSISAEMGMTTIEACIDPQDSIAAPQSGRTCTEPSVERGEDQVIVNLTCTSSLGEERISTLFTGDFETWYRGITKITYSPPSHGEANIAVTVDAKYVGPQCPKAAPR